MPVEAAGVVGIVRIKRCILTVALFGHDDLATFKAVNVRQNLIILGAAFAPRQMGCPGELASVFGHRAAKSIRV